jgi:hypothetical protein
MFPAWTWSSSDAAPRTSPRGWPGAERGRPAWTSPPPSSPQPAGARTISGSRSRSLRPTPGMCPFPVTVSTWPSPNAARACGASLPAGFPRPPGCCAPAAAWSSTPPASWSPCACRRHPARRWKACSDRSARPTAFHPRRRGGVPPRSRRLDQHPAHSRVHRRRAARGVRPAGADTHPYYQLATAGWARQWPVEEIWVTHLTA